MRIHYPAHAPADAGKGSGDQAAAAAAAGGDGKTGDQGKGDQSGKTGDEGKGGAGAKDEGKGADDGKGGKKEEEKGGKAADGKGSEEGSKGGDGKAGESQAPEKYELKIPDEAKQSFGKKALEQFEAMARASGWSNEDAQAEIDQALAIEKEDRAALVSSWTAETKADEDFGGDNLAETERLANAAIDRVFPEGHRLRDRFLAAFTGTGANQRLEFAAFLATVGRMMGEDRGVRGRQAGKPEAKAGTPERVQETADSLYDHPTSKRVQEESLKKA